MFSIDTLRVHAAAVAVAVIRSKGEPCLAMGPGPRASHAGIQQLHIPDSLAQQFKDFNQAVLSCENELTADPGGMCADEFLAWVVLGTCANDAQAWARVLRKTLRSIWSTGIHRLVANLRQCIPADWQGWAVRNRDTEKILARMCHNPKLDELFLCSTALKNGQAIFDTGCAKIGCEPLSTKENTEIAELQDEAKLVLAARAASTTALIRLPEATTPKSKSGYVRECKRLIKSLCISLPAAVLNALEEAASD